jgi:hypothetical protein
MKHFILIGLVLSVVVAATSAMAEDPIVPLPALTPGAILITDVTAICHPGYSKTIRHTSGKLKHQVYLEYGIDNGSGHYEIDHLIPLGIGGADTRENLWPQSRDTQPWNAALKDRLESYLHVEVCAGRIEVGVAQKAIAADWVATYRQYLGEP